MPPSLYTHSLHPRQAPPPNQLSYCTGLGSLRGSMASPILLLPLAHSSAVLCIPMECRSGHLPHTLPESHSQRCPPWGKLLSQLSKVSNPSTQRGRVRHIGDDISAAIPQGLIQIDPVCFSWKFQLISGMRFLSVMELGQVLYRPFSSRGN